MNARTFSPPGPGPWELDGMHVPRPATRLLTETFPAAMEAGIRDSLKRYGSSLAFVEFGFARGFAYLRPRPLGAPAGAAQAPPKIVLRLLTTLHPELRRRRRTARRLFADRPWRRELSRWDGEVKPAAVRAHLELQMVDVRALSDEALAAHVARCLAHAASMIEQHHRFDCGAIVPVGDFLCQAQEWTGLPAELVLRAIAGAAPESAGVVPELADLIEVLRGSPTIAAGLAPGRPATQALAELRARPDEVGAAARRAWEHVAYRLSDGLDPGQPCVYEHPELLVSRLRTALASPPADRSRSRSNDGQVARVRDAVPADRRDTFDALLAEARLVSRLRDERGLYSDIWAWGIARHALLESGRRLQAAGRLGRAADLIEAGGAEIRALLGGEGGPTADELAARAAARAELTAADAPARLGPLAGPPPLAALPPELARVDRAIFTYVRAMFDEREAAVPERDGHASSHAAAVRGLAVNAGQYEGPARVLSGPGELDRIQRGDVLVTASTSAAFNVALPLVGAIVTDRGGLLCHAAIVARELGIPAVVGCREATRRLRDGARIRVDGGTGEARVVA